MKDSKLFAYLGVISALITITDCVVRTIRNAEFTFSLVAIVGIIALCLFLFLHLVIKDKKVCYNIKKIFSYFMRCGDAYFIKNKECIYTFNNRTEMEYTKKHVIISNVNNLKHFCDKFKWSKEQKVSDIEIRSNNPRHKVSVRRVENWHQYTVEFGEVGKGQEQQISITIQNLHDPEKESLLFLSSNIICKTKRLRLCVVFKDDNLKPTNIQYKIYDNYASDFPLLQEELEYNETEHKIEIIESKPIYGFRYEIAWDFEND